MDSENELESGICLNSPAKLLYFTFLSIYREIGSC